MINVEVRRKERSMELLEKVLSGENIANAMAKVISNKGAGGIDKVSAKDFKEAMENKEINFEEIKMQIRNRRYKPSPVRRVYIPKENGDRRGLGIPTVIDRVIQQSIVQVLSPIYEEKFSNNSYGFRKNRSCEMAVIKLLKYFNNGYEWVVDIDLEKFFDNVSHDKLISIIMKTIHDGELISLIRKYLVAGVMENGVIQETMKGTPQGGNLSPLLSNIMLNELDKELEARGLRFVRYADDCIITVRSEKSAKRVMKTITKFIEKKLGLKVNRLKSKVARPTEIKYLGFGFCQDNQGKWKPIPHMKSVQRFVRKLKRLTKRNVSITMSERIKQLNYVIRGWINYFRIGIMSSYMSEIGSHLRRRIRCIIWKQWKTISNRYKCLRKLGASEIQARKYAYSRKSYWEISKSMTLSSAISNERLKRKGLIHPLEYYSKVHIEI